MTKLDELKASLEAAWAVLDAAKAAWVAYKAELKKQQENSDDH